MQEFTVKTARRCQFLDVTAQVRKAVTQSGVKEGVCVVYVPHTTAGVTINENADPDVPADIIRTLDRLVPRSGDYAHREGNADSHVKATTVGASQSIPITEGRLHLGTWQGVFFCEFDGPRTRRLCVQILG